MLSRSILTLLIPVPLILFGLGAAFFIEYQKHRVSIETFGGQQLSPTEYVKLRVDNYRQISKAQAAVAEIDIRDSLPEASEGWTRTRYEVAHGEKITGETFKPSMIVKDTEKSIQDDFRSVKKRQKDAVTASYVKGDEIVSIKIRAVPMIDTSTLEGQVAQRMSEHAGLVEDLQRHAVFTVAGGIEFKLLPQISKHYISSETRPVTYRRFEGGIGKQLDIFVFSNASDTAVLDVIQGIDFATLKAFAKISEAVAAKPMAPEEIRTAAAPPLDEEASVGGSETAEAGVVPSAVGPEKLSFRDRLKGLLGSSGRKKDTPMKTVCSAKQGFKRCTFVEE